MLKLLGRVKTSVDSRRHRISRSWYGGLFSSQGERVAGEIAGEIAGKKDDDKVVLSTNLITESTVTFQFPVTTWWDRIYKSYTCPGYDAYCMVPTRRGLGSCMKDGLWFLGKDYSTGVSKNFNLDNKSESEPINFSPTRVMVLVDGSYWWEPNHVGGESYWLRNEDTGSFICGVHNHNNQGQAKLTAALCEFRAGENGIKAAVALECDEIILVTDCEVYYLAFKECLTKGEYPPVPEKGTNTELTYNHKLQQQQILKRTLDSIPTGTKIKLVQVKREHNRLADVLARMGRVCEELTTCYYSFDAIKNSYNVQVDILEAEKQKNPNLRKKLHVVTDDQWEDIRTSISQPFPTAHETVFITWNGVCEAVY